MHFANYWAHIKLPNELLYDVTKEIAGFDGHISKPKGRVTLIVSVMGKHISLEFLLMNYNTPYNGILGQDRIVPMQVNAYP